MAPPLPSLSEHDTMTAVARHVWAAKYRHTDASSGPERGIEDTWRRVARALARVEANDAVGWAERFYGVMDGFSFLPGGRILAGAGTGHRTTLLNCFVMGPIEDSIDGIFAALREGALTMQEGGGIGYDFSTLRPRGTPARETGRTASGPVSFLAIWDQMCATMLSTGTRRGAMMATLRCDHPDIEVFIDAKRTPGALRYFNLSVQIPDAFLVAVRQNTDWPLVFPVDGEGVEGETVERRWTGADVPVLCRVHHRVKARALWDRLVRSAYDVAEPGVLFVDTINRLDPLGYAEHLTATNPCGEVPLPPYGACVLGSLNLPRFVRAPFAPEARLDLNGLAATASVATRMLDDVIDASRYPLPAQAEQARRTRRIGLGMTGLADALILLGLHYDSAGAREAAAAAMRTVCHAAYRTSVALAREKGPFPLFDRDRHLAGPFVEALSPDLRDGIACHGLRNSHLTASAPAGSISLLAGNVSSGIEPVFAFRHARRVLGADGEPVAFELTDAAYRLWHEHAGTKASLPEAFVEAHRLPPTAHLAMQAALQPYVDQAISKTINISEEVSFEAFRSLFEKAHAMGLKGCTAFRPNPVTGSVLTPAAEPSEGSVRLEPECECP